MEKQESGLALGALLVDLENLYLAYKNQYHNPTDLTVTTLQVLRKHLLGLGVSPVVGRAYAPFDYSSGRSTISDLSLMGITPVHVVSYASKNSADLMLAIDAMEILFRRNDIGVFVIVGGDRDYIPVVGRIQQDAKRVLVVSPRQAMSGDLMNIVGEENYIDPIPLIPEGRVRPLVQALKTPSPVASNKKQTKDPPTAPAPVIEKAPPVSVEVPRATTPTPVPLPTANPRSSSTSMPLPTVKPESAPIPVPLPTAKLESAPTSTDMGTLADYSHEPDDLKALMIIILTFMSERNFREIWLAPFLRDLNDAFPLKNNAERKELLARLVEIGAVEIEDRPQRDDVGTYAVLTVNWAHPLVVEFNPG